MRLSELIRKDLDLLNEARILNQDDLDTYLNQFIDKLTNSNHINFFKKKVKRELSLSDEYTTRPDKSELVTDWDKKDYQADTLRKFKPNNQLTDKLSHIVDWFRSRGMETFNPIGLPDIKTAYTHADNFFTQDTKKVKDDVVGQKTIMTFPDGFKWVQLTTSDALRYEGKEMQHCVGRGSYDKEVDLGTTQIYSLRDKSDNPHCTIEVINNGKYVQQIKGKQNKAVIEKYHNYVKDFLNKFNFKQINDLHNINMIGIDEKIYTFEEFSKLDNFKVSGDLDLENTQITSLPDNLTVDGHLKLRGTPITSLPDNLTVNGYLNLSNSKITKLPDNLTVDGALNLRNTPITSLPDNLTVNGYLDLNNSKITKLPDNLTVDGALFLENTKITKLPDNLKVGNNLNFDGSLVLKGTLITSLPDNLTVNGYLDLSNTKITSLPDNLTVDGDLYLENTKITELPNNLTVNGYLNLSNTKITELPAHLKDKIIVEYI